MPGTELQKKAVSFVLFVILMALLLMLFPLFEDWLLATLAGQFGLTIGADRSVVGSPTSGKMALTIAGLLVYIIPLLKVILWMALIIGCIRFFWQVLLRTVLRGSGQADTTSLLRTVISIVIYIVAFFIIFQTQFPDVQLAPLFTGSTIIGIVVGLALQDTLGNLFAGLALQADQPFQTGDVIAIPGRGEGVVESVSWRGVKIRTFQNKLLIISNAVLGRETIEVAPKDNLNAKAVFFNSKYSHSPARTIQVVRDAVRQIENVSNKIRPVVRIRNLGDNGIDWEVKYWLDDYRLQHDTDALIRQRIWYVFNRENLDFAFPTRTLHIEQKPEETGSDSLARSITDRLNAIPIFAPLSEDETQQLVEASSSRIYAPNEPIVRMGQEGSSMFVIIRGSVKVQIPEKGYQKTINQLGENDFFGEMSLLTGEPRSASVIALEETEVLQIKKTGLKPILENNPGLVESICELMDERRQLLTTQESTEKEAESNGSKGVMRSIKNFFGLN